MPKHSQICYGSRKTRASIGFGRIARKSKSPRLAMVIMKMSEKIADIQIEYLDPQAAEVKSLIAVSDNFYDGLYPEDSNHLEALDDLDKPNVLFIGCRVDGALVASGEIVISKASVLHTAIQCPQRIHLLSAAFRN